MAKATGDEREPLLGAATDSPTVYGSSGSSQDAGEDRAGPAKSGDGDKTTQVEAGAGASPADDDGKPKVRMAYVLPALALGLFLAALDSSVVSTNYVRIATEFNSLELAQWISSAYFLTYASLQPLYGKLSDIYGRKPCLMFCYSVFGVGCLLCGLAQSMPQFIAARVVQGCGGAGIGTVITVLLSDLVPLKERAPWQGYLNLIGALGMSLGAPVGGLFADSIGWRWTFAIQAPLMCPAVISVALFLRVPAVATKKETRLRDIDFLGALLIVLAVIALLLGLDRGSAVSFAHPSSYVPLALAPVVLGAFVLTERYVAVDPVMAGAIVRARTPLAVYALNFFVYGAWSALVFFVPLFYQAVDGVSSAQAGVRLLPAIVCGVSGNVLGGHALRRWGRYRALLLGSGLVVTLAMAPLLVAMGRPNRWDVVLVSVGTGVNGFFYGAMAIGSLIALLSAVTPADQATATATMFLARALGSAIAVSLGGSLFQAALRSQLREALRGWRGDLDPKRVAEGVRRSLAFLGRLEPELRTVVRGGYARAVQAVMWAITGGFAASCAAAFWVVQRKTSSG